jgi:hypothetical protein
MLALELKLDDLIFATKSNTAPTRLDGKPCPNRRLNEASH